MDISHRIVIPTFLLLVLFTVDLGESQNGCPELRCGEDGPDIRFPFRLKDRQPDQHCGYPGFDLYCSDKNHTVLELTSSVKAFVKHIDYESQLINVIDSDNCFPRKIRELNLSSSPFQFHDFLLDYSLFNCTPPETDRVGYESYDPIHCLSSRRHLVYAFISVADIDDLPILSCTKMYSVPSFPPSIWYDPPLVLTWSKPKCGDCEVKGKKCIFKSNTKIFKTECFDPNKDKGIVLFLPNMY